MNKHLVFLLLVVSALVQANPAQETFLKANAYYEKGHKEEALTLYEKIEPQYPAVWYNKGLCFYTLGHYPLALHALRMAQRLGTRDLFFKASQAIDLTQRKLQLPPDAALFHTLLFLHTVLPGDFMRFLFLLSLAVFSLLVWFRWAGKWVRGLTVLLLLLSGTCCAYEYWFSQQRYGVVLAKDTMAYAGPDTQFHAVAALALGQQVKVVEEEQSWYKVYFPGGQGWVQGTDLGLF